MGLEAAMKDHGFAVFAWRVFHRLRSGGIQTPATTEILLSTKTFQTGA